jgi:multidrug efflux pump subunit AcrB
LTTFFGLAPMVFETSRQAQFVVPMAVSLGFGILFTTIVCLLVLPSLYLVINNRRRMKMEDKAHALNEVHALRFNKP